MKNKNSYQVRQRMLLAPEPNPLPWSIVVKRNIFSFWCVLLELSGLKSLSHSWRASRGSQ